VVAGKKVSLDPPLPGPASEDTGERRVRKASSTRSRVSEGQHVELAKSLSESRGL
jgi:hypothetical protein